MTTLCITPRVHGTGGMVSFFYKFSAALERRGITVTTEVNDPSITAALILGGTRNLAGLWRLKRRGVRLVQRLDGINWIQRVKPAGWRHAWRAESGNLALAFIRRFLADEIIYQSEFSRRWWNGWYGELKTPFAVRHNGVDLNIYRPSEQVESPVYRLLVVEGAFGGGYEGGLENAVRLAEATAPLLGRPLELAVAGEVAESLRVEWSGKSAAPIRWLGKLPREAVPALMNSAHALFSADVHPACPNAVIEALACGLPVVAYDTGSLSELVPDSAGRIAPYAANPWRLETPSVGPLARGLAVILQNQAGFRAGARARAEAAFGLDAMTETYLEHLF
ncbi:glycosyltransferase family 4 protein [bacterium]|nr:glycosyltransferase family 4 protein [bacterium]NCT20709.1 glycosyltransferase family 4 protein [bacterium]OIO86123.1 MAG: hypothetical protein AUK01_04105 [Anaerolineae bacterium CG2_30_57_67]